MSSKIPRLHTRLYQHQGEAYIIISRGHLTSMKVRMTEATTLANELIDLVEEGEADGVPTMR